jgi:large subunit ribosomal protein L29
MTSPKELVTYDTEHLRHELSERRKELVLMRFQAVIGQLGDVSQLKKTKREIARILTILRERDLDVFHIPPKPENVEKLAGRKERAEELIARKETELQDINENEDEDALEPGTSESDESIQSEETDD